MALPTKRTERLILRPLQLTDLDDFYEYAQDPAVYNGGMWQPYDSIDDARSELENLITHYYDGLMWWAIEHQSDRKMIGRIELSHVDRDDKKAEISYALHQDYWQQGIMSEAMEVIVDYAFNTMNLYRIYAVALIDNEPSHKLLEKFKFQREGQMRAYSQVKGYPEDAYLYARLKSD